MQHKSMFRLVFERFLEHRLALASLGVVIIFVLLAIGADSIAHILHLDPDSQDILSRYSSWSHAHWLGSDEAGRDVFIRLIYGARVSLFVAFISAIAAVVIGIAVGSVAGYFGGWIESMLMRITDAFLTLPQLPLLIVLAAIDFCKLPLIGRMFGGEDSSILKMVLIFLFFSWMTVSRLIHGAVVAIRHQEFVMAAQTMGMKSWEIILKEIVPNVVSPVIVAVTLRVGQTILGEATLSFLGLGIQPPTPSWGNMMTNALEAMYYRPSLVVMPGLLILFIVVSFNFLGDGLQDALDPKAIRR